MGWSSNVCKLRDSSCFGILTGSLFRINLVIRLKGGRNLFLGQNLALKPQNFPKSISRKPFVVESWLPPQNDRKIYFTMGALIMYTTPTTEVALKIQSSVFLGLIMTKLLDFPYLLNHWSHKVGWVLKMTARMDLPLVFYDMHTPQTTGNHL